MAVIPFDISIGNEQNLTVTQDESMLVTSAMCMRTSRTKSKCIHIAGTL